MFGLDPSSETNIEVLWQFKVQGGREKVLFSPCSLTLLCCGYPQIWHENKRLFGWSSNYAEYLWPCNKLQISIIDLDNVHSIVKCSDFYFADCRKSEITYQGSIYSLDLVWVRSSYHCWSGAITAAKRKLISTYRALCCCKLRSRFGLKLNIPVRNVLI